MNFKQEIEHEVSNIDIDQKRNEFWSILKNLSLDRDEMESLSDFEIGFFSLFFKRYNEVFIPMVEELVIPEFEEWYEVETPLDEIKLQSFNIDKLADGAWEVFWEDANEDLLVGFVMKGWELDYTTRIG